MKQANTQTRKYLNVADANKYDKEYIRNGVQIWLIGWAGIFHSRENREDLFAEAVFEQ